MADIGRPTIKTKDLVDKLIEAFHDDATVEQACYVAGIHKTTYYDWLKQDEDFSYEMSKAQEYPKVISKKVLIDAVEAGDKQIALEIIKRREKERYSERLENTGKDGKDLIPQFIVSTKESKKELEKLYKDSDEGSNSTNNQGV